MTRDGELERAAARNNINFTGYGGLCINNRVVSEFEPHLRYLTNGQLRSFSDFAAIYAAQHEIRNAIQAELESPATREESRLKVDRDIAEDNLRKVEEIVTSICRYQAVVMRLGEEGNGPNK